MANPQENLSPNQKIRKFNFVCFLIIFGAIINLLDPIFPVNVVNFPQLAEQAARMRQIIEGQDDEYELYEMIQCVKSILKCDSTSGSWDAQVEHTVKDVDVDVSMSVDNEPEAAVILTCEPGG
jgi:hypothetical protein